MKYIINQKVPSCPRCAAGMHMRKNMHLNHTPLGGIYICKDCNGIFRVLGVGQIENEIVVGDNMNDEVTDEDFKGSDSGRSNSDAGRG